MDTPLAESDASPEKEQPEKYIRTFAGDMDALKKSDTPVAAATTPPHPPLGKLPLPEPGGLKESSPSFIPQQPAPAIPKDPLQTYEGDFSQRVQTTHASTATILAAEQDNTQRRVFRPAPIERERINIWYSIAGVALLLISAGGGYAAYRQYRATMTPPITEPIVTAPIFFDEKEEVSGAGSTLLQSMTDSSNRPLAAGTVRLLYVASTTGTVNIFSLLPLSPPDALLRNIGTANSMAGVVSAGGSQGLFFILPISSYSTVFSAMLLWEPVMPDYFAALFPSVVSQNFVLPDQTVASSTATTTSAVSTTTQTVMKSTKKTEQSATTTSSLTYTAGFYDASVSSHDVRVYRDTEGREVFLYGFWNQSTLVIARNTAAFTEVIGRLATAPPR